MVIVVVARREEHRHGHVRQRLRQRPDGFRIHPLPVEQVAGEEDQIDLLVFGQPGQPWGDLPQLPAALGALFRRQAGQGGVQMKIRRVEQFHFSSILSDIKHVHGGQQAQISCKI